MRTFRGGLLVLAAASFLFLQGHMAKAEQKVTVNKQVTSAAKPAAPVANPAVKKAGKAGGYFPSSRNGKKDIGICSISCNDGSGGDTFAFDVQDCACQCAGACGGSCVGVDLDTGELAFC